jgi:hypothetical protein
VSVYVSPLNEGQRTLGVTTGALEVVDDTDDTLDDDTGELELLEPVEVATTDELDVVVQPLTCRAPQTPASVTEAPTEDLR